MNPLPELHREADLLCGTLNREREGGGGIWARSLITVAEEDDDDFADQRIGIWALEKRRKIHDRLEKCRETERDLFLNICRKLQWERKISARFTEIIVVRQLKR